MEEILKRYRVIQGDLADMVTEVYGHTPMRIEERCLMMEKAFYGKEDMNPQMRGEGGATNTISVPEGVDAELLMKVLGNPEMAALLNSMWETMKG